MRVLNPSILLLGLLVGISSAEVIRCPHHDEPDPQWNRRVTGSMVAGRTLADPAPRMLETAHFAIFYQASGVHAVSGAAVDRDGNGHPDNVDSIGAIAERVWRLSIDTLEYLKPVPYDMTRPDLVKDLPPHWRGFSSELQKHRDGEKIVGEECMEKSQWVCLVQDRSIFLAALWFGEQICKTSLSSTGLVLSQVRDARSFGPGSCIRRRRWYQNWYQMRSMDSKPA